jgi:quinol monooxygenase YgiN
MAIAILFEIPNGSQEHYDVMNEHLKEMSAEEPPGRISHIAGPTSSGWRMVEVWESKEAFEVFASEFFTRALHESATPEPQLSMWEVHKMYHF